MTVELWVLVWSSVLFFALIAITSSGNLMTMGMAWGIGNRDEASTASGWIARGKRAYLNLLENLVLYGGIAVPAHLAGVHNDMTVLGAQIFLVARLAHAAFYLAGLSVLGVRTLAYFAGVVGTAMILIEML